jgi:hypothetical protein
MARIRTIKPEFFTSEDIVSLSPMARLLYIALWCEADREGRMTWRPKTFKMRYLPADSCDVDALCQELVAAKLVKLYGEGLAYIPRFHAHQHVNPRESASTLPNPEELTRRPRVSTRASTVSDAQGGREGKGKEGVEDASPDGDGPDDPALQELPLNDGSDFRVTASMVSEWVTLFPAVDVPQALRNMRAWLVAKPSRRKTRRGVETFIVGWLTREQDRGGGGKVAANDAPVRAGLFEGGI